ncbi:MAG: hypothetical protein ABI397_00335 [Candidatus Saccharimonas sp.]
MYIAILGRLTNLSIAELERLYGSRAVTWHSAETALIDSTSLDFNRLGGSRKAGRVIADIPRGDWRTASERIIHHYVEAFSSVDHKITLGISAYGFDSARTNARDIQKTGIVLKQRLRKHDVGLRLVPNADLALNTATSHHNKLGLSPNKIELLVVRGKANRIIIAESIGAQNITAIAARDQARPHTDAFVGMLPPKLAQIMINLAVGNKYDELPVDRGSLTGSREVPLALEETSAARASAAADATEARREAVFEGAKETSPLPIAHMTKALGEAKTILDPFCGTGVVLQEALLMGYSAYGSDLSEKMVDYSTKNLAWLDQKYHTGHPTIELADATDHKWHQPIDAVVAETYLGQPFSAPPSPAKLTEVRNNCNHIVGKFLNNLSSQLAAGTPLCIAVPAWRDKLGDLTHLPLTADSELRKLGYTRVMLETTPSNNLIYSRENQVVTREILILTKN